MRAPYAFDCYVNHFPTGEHMPVYEQVATVTRTVRREAAAPTSVIEASERGDW